MERTESQLNPDADEFKFEPRQKKIKSTVYDYLSSKPKTKKLKPEKNEKKEDNRMVKAHIVIDGEVVTAKIAKKDLYSGAYEVVQRKTTKLKKLIKDSRVAEGNLPNDRPLRGNLDLREYVDQMITQDLDLAIQELLDRLIYYYKRKKEEKTNKKVQKRFVKGFKECIKKANEKTLKMLIMAPDIENVEGEGGLNDLINEVLSVCKEANIPIVFGLSMRGLGQVAINGAALMSVIGIVDYSACEKLFNSVLEISKRNKENYQNYCYDPSHYFNLGLSSY